jgi:hypothetical protein
VRTSFFVGRTWKGEDGMSGKRFCLGALVAALLGLGAARAWGQAPTPMGIGTPVPYSNATVQQPVPPTGPYSPGTIPPVVPGQMDQPGNTAGIISPVPLIPEVSPDNQIAQGPGGPPPIIGSMSTWLAYPRSLNCCCPTGKCGPIGSELYLRGGVVFPFGAGALGHTLLTGWDIDGGGRVLFFNPQVNRAFTFSLGVSNIHNASIDSAESFPLYNVAVRTTASALQQVLQNQAANGTTTPGTTNTTTNRTNTTGAVNGSTGGTTNPSQSSPTAIATPVTITVPHVQVTVQAFNQTFFNAAGGYAWWLLGSGDPAYCGPSWRVGFEVGGRWGTARIDFNEIQHHTDVVGGLFFAVESYFEYPCNCCILQTGPRLEYNYIWNDALQVQNPSDFQSINLLWTIGMRF